SRASVPPLAVGAVAPQAVQLAIPGGAGTGPRYLLVFANADRVQAETSFANNTLVLPLTLTAPDLVATGPQAPATAASGSFVDLSFTVANQGSVAAPVMHADKFYISTKPTFDASARLLTSQTRSTPLAAGGSYSVSASVALPGTLGAGSYYVLFF